MNCTIENCKTPARSRGLCVSHYGSHYRNGTLDVVAPKQKKHTITEIDRFDLTATCAICGPVKVIRDGKRYRCHVHQTTRRRHQKAKRHGMDNAEALETYTILWEAQGGVCAVCGQTEPLERRLALDHCHETNRVRGLLCTRCNLALGLLDDDVQKMKSAITYLVG